VTEPVHTSERIVGEDLFELVQLARAPTDIDAVAIDDREPGRVIAAVFEPA
jgi:hypothetical protein